MVVKVDKHGNRIHSPPYTKAEQDEFYRRTAVPALRSDLSGRLSTLGAIGTSRA